ncbi:MAG: PEP-utilizing enzyme [Actinomycetota bacterium]
MGTKWMIEGTIDPRWPINTRGNIGEVFPEVLTALSYELGVVPAERAWRDAYAELGIHSDGDFQTDDPVIIGLYGGYCYLNLSYLRMMGVRAPGSSAEAIDVAFFGEGNPPPYQSRKGDKSLSSSLKILRTVMGALGTDELPDVVADSFARVDVRERSRPSLDAPDEELLAFLYSLPEAFAPVFGNHMKSTAIAAIVSGVLADACAAAGEPGLVTHLIGASGEVRSARYSQELYALAGIARNEPAVSAAFEEGVDGLLDRLRASDDDGAGRFLESFGGFVAEHGHRGPNDWELSSRTWENTPELALAAVDSMRRAEHDLSPGTRLGDDEQKRQEAVAVVRPHLNFLDKMNFDKAVKSVKYWSQAREATRDRAVRVTFSTKQVYRELVRRGAQRGGNPDPVKVALLFPRTELPQHLADPSSMADVVAERGALFDRYSAVEPKFFISSQDEVPTIEELEADQPEADGVVAVGTSLTGSAGCSGVATGRARVVLDPADGAALEPGEILVAPLTDPSWTPLFLPAAAVVVNVGALMSHAVIVARELGIPCVVAVEGATDKLQTGMMVTVDGTEGTVTVVDG